MKPESVLKATRLVKTGEVIEIAHVLNDKMAISATRGSTCTRSARS